MTSNPRLVHARRYTRLAIDHAERGDCDRALSRLLGPRAFRQLSACGINGDVDVEDVDLTINTRRIQAAIYSTSWS